MSVITNFTDWVTLAETKDYLRIDAGITESDTEITVMINAACELIQTYTEHYFKPQARTYYFTHGCARVYATPITSVTLPVEATDYSIEVKQMYSIYTPVLTTLKSITFDIGYTDTDQIKDIFKYAVWETVKLWFYGSESETVMKGYVPSSVLAILAGERRFIL